MNFRLPLLLSLGALSLVTLEAASSDILPPSRRKATVELAGSLSTAPVLQPLPADMKSPFTPPGFDQPDPAELAARAAAQAAANSQPSKPTSDRELLSTISDKLTPSGSAFVSGEQVLLFPGKKLRKGDKFIITYDGRDFELELTDIQRTTFSLRLNRAEITRPIKLGKNQ